MKAFHQGLIDAFPDAVYTTDLVVAEASWAFAHYQAEATHNGELQGIAPTGKRVVWTGTNAFRVDCGRIVESWSSLDELGRPRQLGALPAEAVASPDVVEPSMDLAPPAACPAPDRASVEAAVGALWDKGWNDGDAVALAAVLAADVDHHRTNGDDAKGSAALARRIASFRDALPDYRLTHGPIAVDGDYAAAYWTASGTNTGGMMGAEPTGKALTWDGITIVRLECGKIADVWSEADILGLQRQLGLLP